MGSGEVGREERLRLGFSSVVGTRTICSSETKRSSSRRGWERALGGSEKSSESMRSRRCTKAKSGVEKTACRTGRSSKRATKSPSKNDLGSRLSKSELWFIWKKVYRLKIRLKIS